MNANLIFTWLRDPRFAPDHDPTVAPDDAVGFLPIEIEGSSGSSEMPSTPVSLRSPKPDALISAHRVDITLSDGRRILVEGPTTLASVLCIVHGLMP